MRTLFLVALTLFFGFKSKGLGSSTTNILNKKINGKSKDKKQRSAESGSPQRQVEEDGHIPPDFRVSFKLKGFSPAHERKMRQALARLSYVVKTAEFKQKVLEHSYQGKKQFYQNKGLSNKEIYQAILDGVESLNPVEDNTMNLQLTLYTSETNTVGYTYPNTNEIWVNTKYFERYSLAEVANNAMHEWLHKIGFEHSYYNNDDRPYTVPYAIGEIVEDIMLKMGE